MIKCLFSFIGLFLLVGSVVASENSTRELDSQLRHTTGGGNVAECKKLLKQGAALNGRGQGGVTPLYVASLRGHGEVVRLLLGSKALVNAACDDGTTPLYVASERGHDEVVKLLLVSKALVNAADDDGTTPLYVASERGHDEVVKLLLVSKVLVNAADDDGTAPLFIASQTGHYEVVKLLLGGKAQVEAAKKDGATPLYVASGRGHGGVVKLLLVNKAQVNAARADGVMPLIIASQNGHGDVCQLLLDSGAAINRQTKKSKRTALHTAVLHNHFDCARVLLKAGADVTACDVQGDTPLVYAAKQKNRKLSILLSKYVAEIGVSHQNINKSYKKLPEYVQNVLNQNKGRTSSIDPDCKPIDNLLLSGQGVSHYSELSLSMSKDYDKIFSTLHAAAQTGDCEKLEMIFGFGAPVDQLNAEGHTALQLAVLGGHYAMCAELLKYGADKNIKTPNGETALELAQRVGNKKLIDLLNSAGS